MKDDLTIEEMLSEIKYELRNDPDLCDMIKEGLKLIMDKLKDQRKWKKK